MDCESVTETPFTDDDLKAFKIHTMAHGGDAFVQGKTLALIARLEAAECNMGGHSAKCSDLECVCSKKDREAAWRKAAGKEKGNV